MPLEKLPFLPEQASYVYGAGKDIVSTELEGGLSRSRRDIVGASVPISVSFTFDLIEYQYFRSFFNFYTNRGATPFLIDLLLDQPYIEEYTAKFIPESLQMNNPIGLSRVVTAQLEVVPIDNPDLDEVILLFYNPDGENEYSNLLEQLANYDLEVMYD